MGSFRKNGCGKVTSSNFSVFTPDYDLFRHDEGWLKVGKSLTISVKPAEEKYEPLGV